MPRKTRDGGRSRKKLAVRLRQMRMTQTALARATGKGVTLVNHFCVHGIRTAHVAKFYARFLGCRPEELIDF